MTHPMDYSAMPPQTPQQPQAPQQQGFGAPPPIPQGAPQAPQYPQQPQAPQQYAAPPQVGSTPFQGAPQQQAPQYPQQPQQQPQAPQQYAAPPQAPMQPQAQPPMQQPQQYAPQPGMPVNGAAPAYGQQPPAPGGATTDFAAAFADDAVPNMHDVQEGGGSVSVGYGLGRLCAAIYVGKQHYTSRGGYKVRGEIHLAYELIGAMWPAIDGRRPIKKEILNYSFNSRARLHQRILDMDPHQQFRNIFQMVGQPYLIELGEEANQQGGTYVAIKGVKYPVQLNPRTGVTENWAQDIAPPTVALMAFNYDRPQLSHWDSIYIGGVYDNGGTKNTFQNAVRCAVDFLNGPVAQMLQAAGRDIWTDYENGQPVQGSRERNIQSVNEWVAFKQGRGPFPGANRDGQQNNQQQQQPQAPQQYGAPQPNPVYAPQVAQAPQQAPYTPGASYTPQAALAPQQQAPQYPQQPPQAPQYPQQPQQQPQAPQQPQQQPQAPQQYAAPLQAPVQPQAQPPMQQPQQYAAPQQAPGMPPMTGQPQYAPGSVNQQLDDHIPY